MIDEEDGAMTPVAELRDNFNFEEEASQNKRKCPPSFLFSSEAVDYLDKSFTQKPTEQTI